MPSKVLFAAQRSDGLYIAAAFDYGEFVCQFETGIDEIARFDAHLEVYGSQKVVRIQYDTPYVRNLPIRLFVSEDNGRGGVTELDSNPAWGDPFVAEWKAFLRERHGKQGAENRASRTSFKTLSCLPKWRA